MIEGYLYLFPLAVSLLIPFAYILSLFVGIYLGHVKFEYLFLSQSSTDSPESCITSQLINFASFLLVITIYIRHRQIAELIRNNPTCGMKYSRTNFIFLFCGTIAAFGLSIICNFPHSNVSGIRIVARYLTFITSMGTLYCEMLLSHWIQPLLYSSRLLPVIRMILTIISTLILLAFLIFQSIKIMKYENIEQISSPITLIHLCSNLSIWILSCLFLMYVLTLVFDFRRMKIISPKIFLSNDIIDDPMNNALSFSLSI